jgi:hypothetical protein
MAHTLDHIAAAVRRALLYGDSEIKRYFCMNMDSAARLKFDGYLVQSGDPLAWEAGTCEHRFFTRCKAMADLERRRLGVSNG